MAENTAKTQTIIDAAKELTIHASVKSPEEVAAAFAMIYSAIVTAVEEKTHPKSGESKP